MGIKELSVGKAIHLSLCEIKDSVLRKLFTKGISIEIFYRFFYTVLFMLCSNYWFLCSNFRPFPNKNVQMLDHFFPLLFPKDSESLKIFDFRLWEVWAKRPLNSTSKVNRQTHGQTDRQMDISIYRKHWPRGPMLWKLKIIRWLTFFLDWWNYLFSNNVKYIF